MKRKFKTKLLCGKFAQTTINDSVMNTSSIGDIDISKGSPVTVLSMRMIAGANKWQKGKFKRQIS